MSLIEVLTSYWDLVVRNPVPFILTVAAGTTVGATAIRALMKSRMETLRERLAAAQDELERIHRRDGSVESRSRGPEYIASSEARAEELPNIDPGVEQAAESEAEANGNFSTIDDEDEEEEEDDSILLEEDQEDVLQLISSRGSLGPIHISGLLDVSEQKALLLCEQLQELGLVAGRNHIPGPLFSVMRQGREYLDQNDLLE